MYSSRCRSENAIYVYGAIVEFLLLIGATLAGLGLHFVLAGVLVVSGLGLFVAAGIHSLLY